MGECGKQRIINFGPISCLFSVFILMVLMVGCAGPIMHTIPTKPSVIETEPRDIPQNIELFAKSAPGELLKYDIFINVTGQARGKVENVFGSGQINLSIENVSHIDNVTIRGSGELYSGIIGKRLTKTKVNCRTTISNKGKVLSTDCPGDKNFNFLQPFPDGSISIGSQWNELSDFYDENFGKIQSSNYYILRKFSSINNRLCAKIDFEGKLLSQISSKEFTIIDLKSKGYYYQDLKLGLPAYAENLISMEVFLNNIKEKLYLTLEIIVKLDFQNSVFKRPVIEYSTPAEIIQPQGVDITPKPQPPLPEKPQTIKPITPPTVTSPPVINTVVVTGTFANIRSGAGNEFSIVTTVKQGDKLILLGEHGEWFNVRLENGQEGWINKRFVK